MSIVSKIGLKSVRFTDGIVNTSILFAILLLFGFGAFSMWDINQVHSVACSSRYERYRPTVEYEDGGISFAGLQEINPDVFAWLNVYGTNIDYPVVQGQDNMQYVSMNIFGRHSLAGAIFLDYRNARDFSDFNNVLHGHHMANQVMFGEVSMFSDADYFNERRYGTLFFDGQEHGIDFFAFINVAANNRSVYRPHIIGEEAKQEHLDMIFEVAMHVHEDVVVTTADRLVLLSTCSPGVTHMRDVLIGVITDEVRPNPFPEEERETIITILPQMARIDALPDVWGGMDGWMQAAIVALAILLIVIACAVLFGKKGIAALSVGLLFSIIAVQAVSASSVAEVILPVRQFAPDGVTFMYRLTAYDVDHEDRVFSITGNQTVDVGPIIFRHGGIYHFSLQTTSPDRDGIVTDRRVINITVYVTHERETYVAIYRGEQKLDFIYFQHERVIYPPPPPPPEPPPTEQYVPNRPLLPLIPQEPRDQYVPADPDEPYVPGVPDLIDPPPVQEPECVVCEPCEPCDPCDPLVEVLVRDDPIRQEREDDGKYVSPQTGDLNNPGIWAAVLAAAGIGLGLVLVISHKKRKEPTR